ncbi:MAG: GAF domain-containing protein [Firmicutes bacterium]|nr:GAF domain-containing protein [Bacillota bacterium]
MDSVNNIDYNTLTEQLSALVAGERCPLPNLSNASALLWYALPDINWGGFYISVRAETGERELLLGPFQGKTACIRIKYGRGVCGTAASGNNILTVDNVHEFPGHIACDSASNSEIVIPLHDAEGSVVGVLDIDSTSYSRFTESDRVGLSRLANILEKSCDWDSFKKGLSPNQ